MVPDGMEAIARRYVWWQEPAVSLARQSHLLCQVMQLGTPEDVRTVRNHLGDDALRAALRDAPPGVLDARSWTFWHLFLFNEQPPPMPRRPLPT
ncbi:hypothetical protein BH11MYX2_BH11MYX2_37860 [soil metagenome]